MKAVPTIVMTLGLALAAAARAQDDEPGAPPNPQLAPPEMPAGVPTGVPDPVAMPGAPPQSVLKDDSGLPKGGDTKARNKAAAKSLTNIDVVDLNQIGVEETKDDAGSHASSNSDETVRDVTDSIHIDEILEPETDYHYSAFGKPNPFQSPDLNMQSEKKAAAEIAATAAAGGAAGAEIPIVSPLQEYSLHELEVKGIWQLGTTEWRSIIMTPKKEGIIVKVGDPISAGKVMTIDRDKVVARQYQIRLDGAREFDDQEMFLLPSKAKKAGKIILKPGKEPEFFNPNPEEKKPEPAKAQAQPLPEVAAQDGVAVDNVNAGKAGDAVAPAQAPAPVGGQPDGPIDPVQMQQGAAVPIGDGPKVNVR